MIMAIFNISEKDQEKVTEKIKDFMVDKGLKGEVELVFTKDFSVKEDDDEARGPCFVQTSTGRWVVQNPCQS
jgi:hypothetical protein